ncbi:ABC transporter ATP-binding protein [Patescibacteria group bacterium]|nr:ABC transporter ATP-binding protein [Patescibacteria group bacterium]
MNKSSSKNEIVSYVLPTDSKGKGKGTFVRAYQSLAPLLSDQRGNLTIALVAIVINALSTLLAPVIIAHVVDVYITHGNFDGILIFSLLLLVVYVVGLFAAYFQTKRMGLVGRSVLFKMRNELFTKLQELPIAFFNQNKTGDLISRINSDTDKLNQFFAQALVQFAGSAFLIGGAGIFLLALNFKLGLAALIPALLVLVITQFISGWVKRKSRAGLQSLGAMSAEIQESLNNFKVIVAFNRLDYFREKFDGANQANYKASIEAGIASNLFTPLYGLASNLGQLIVLAFGLYLILSGHLTVGLLIGYILYVNNFYNPLRQLAAVWSSLQLALASLDRIQDVLALQSNMQVIPEGETSDENAVLAFKDVSFGYPGGQTVLNNVSFTLERGKTYALVGPTGGGKTTTASLMARLYDPTSGTIFLDGKDVRSYEPSDRVQKIGFILQEPFLFSGTVRDNIVYGNAAYTDCSDEQLTKVIEEAHLTKLVSRFEEGLATKVAASGDALSLGQKQLIAFMGAALRDPEILILDEATANIDTVTEQLLEEILDQLPASTTKVIIAHRLNTIQNADEIFFVNGGTLTPAGSMEHAVELLLHGKRSS